MLFEIVKLSIYAFAILGFISLPWFAYQLLRYGPYSPLQALWAGPWQATTSTHRPNNTLDRFKWAFWRIATISALVTLLIIYYFGVQAMLRWAEKIEVLEELGYSGDISSTVSVGIALLLAVTTLYAATEYMNKVDQLHDRETTVAALYTFVYRMSDSASKVETFDPPDLRQYDIGMLRRDISFAISELDKEIVATDERNETAKVRSRSYRKATEWAPYGSHTLPSSAAWGSLENIKRHLTKINQSIK
jgi:hypothetical protein